MLPKREFGGGLRRITPIGRGTKRRIILPKREFGGVGVMRRITPIGRGTRRPTTRGPLLLLRLWKRR